MKNLKNYGVQEMNTKEMENTDGGTLWQTIVAGAVAVGAACAWAFEKGEELGESLAH